jgi:hypothetical protein
LERELRALRALLQDALVLIENLEPEAQQKAEERRQAAEELRGQRPSYSPPVPIRTGVITTDDL